MVVTRFAGVVALLVAAAASPVAPPEPVVSARYRGSPAGQPRLDDLAAIRAIGFTGVTWPLAQPDRLTELRGMAATVGLAVIVRPPPRVPYGDGVAVVSTLTSIWRSRARWPDRFPPARGAPSRKAPACCPSIPIKRKARD